MGDNPLATDSFEFLLQQRSTKRPARIYGDTPMQPNNSCSLYTAKDVIQNVAETLRTMQNADVVKYDRNAKKKLAQCKKSQFLSVSTLLGSTEDSKPHATAPPKFDTQCVSDTQLIDVIEKAEVIDVENGMTQEFETTFCCPLEETAGCSEDKSLIRKKTKSVCGVNEAIESPETTENVLKCTGDDKVKENSSDDIVYKTSQTQKANSQIKGIIESKNITETKEVTEAKEVIETLKDTQTLTRKNTDLLNESIEIEMSLENLGVLIEEAMERSDSPVLETNLQTTRLANTQHLVVDLEEFENFERAAAQLLILEDADDVNNLVNSQILKKEVTQQTELEKHDNIEEISKPRGLMLGMLYGNEDCVETIESGNFVVDDEVEMSQILASKTILTTDSNAKVKEIFDSSQMEQITKRNEDNDKPVQPDKVECEKILKTEDFEIVQSLNSNASETQFKDEILFSSDEEEDYIHKSFQELPFTCALETSFYNNESDILDKTMFVGFQTASNKSIQISVDSYDMAKSVLEPVSLKDLVEKCSGNMQIEKNTDVDCIKDSEFSKHIASGKDFAISEEVMLRSNAVYKELDIELPAVIGDTSMHVIGKFTVEENDTEEALEKNTFKDLSDIFDAEMKNMSHENETVKPILNVTEENAFLENKRFVGFKTANNKNISISKKALENCRKVFQDIDNIGHKNIFIEVIEPMKDKAKPVPNTVKDVLINVPNNVKQTFKGFATASNKEIKISDKALAKSKSLFQDIDLSEEFDKEISLVEDLKADSSVNNRIKLCETINEVNDALVEAVSKPDFVGFKTAGNKHIDISKQALAKSMKVFHNTFTDTGMNNTTKNSITKQFGGFKTASNKKIQISDKALEKSKYQFQNIDFSEEFDKEISVVADLKVDSYVSNRTKHCELTNNVNDTLVEAVSKPAFVGFKTAGNKHIDISKQALAKSMKVFQNTITSTGMNDTTGNSVTKQFGGFKTASNKNIHVSEKALAKTKDIFQDIDTIDGNLTEQTNEFVEYPDNEKNYEDGLDIVKGSKFVGFQTASKKPVTVSKAALEITNTIFQDIDKVDGKPYEDSANKNTTVFKEFQAASKIPVSMTKSALERSKHVFQYIDNIKNVTENFEKGGVFSDFATARDIPVRITKGNLEKTNNIYDDFDKNGGNHTFQGFMTANNKKIGISKEAFEKSNKLFEDITELKNDADKETHSFLGFITASNKKIEISKEAVEKSKKLFDDITELNNTAATAFKGFQTASNTLVPINQDCLTKAKNLLNHKSTTESKNIHFPSFQTASNKAVKISAEALAKTKHILKDIDFDDEKDFGIFDTANKKTVDTKEVAVETNNLFDNIKSHTEIPAKKAIFHGFQTASKKKVQISEDALAKCKEIFKDIEISQKMPESQIVDFKNAKNYNDNLKQVKNALTHTTNVKCVEMKSTKYTLNQIKRDAIEVELDTQLVHNFEEALNTEDFCPKTPKNFQKRSGSPILSCPKAKIRKSFKTPYRTDTKVDKQNEKIVKVGEIQRGKLQFDKEYKTHRYYTLKNIELLEKESKDQANIDTFITNWTFDDLLNLEFTGQRNNINVEENLKIEDLKKYFEESVDKKIIPKGWFENHVQLILWKLISYEVRFPKLMVYSCNAKTVIDQLKYRYDRELCKVERPALRKILEKDDVSTRTLVLCVVSIFADDQKVTSVTNPNASIELVLTDGWYSVKACLDKMLSKLVFKGKITVGCKVVTHGAEILNCDQGISPWEDTSKVRLKLFGNSTRRAKWDARLGYHGNGAILSHLSNVKVDGGKVPKIRVLVTRVYPLIYVEKFEDGSTVTRSERLEQIYQMKYESDRQIQLEKLYEDVEKEFYDDQESQDSDPEPGSGKRRCMESGSQITKMMKRSNDPMEFRESLTASQQALLADHSATTRDRVLRDIQARVQQRMVERGLAQARNVVALLKIRVADACHLRGVTKGLMSIWRPNDAILELLQEGTWVDVMDVVPTALRYSELQLTAGRQSTFDRAKVKETDKLTALSQSLSRTCYSIKDLTQKPNQPTDYNEIDTVGVVFAIEPNKLDFEKESAKNRHLFQNVYLTDVEKNFLCINFWGGVKKFGFENVLDTGQVIAGTNLQKRAGNTRKSIPQYRATEFTYFTKTPKNATARDMAEELVKKIHGIDRRKFCQDCVEIKNKMAPDRYRNNAENVTPYRFHNADYNLSKNKIFIDSPLAQKPLQRRGFEDLNLTGLDFESTFKQRDSQDLSPEELKRKQKVREKLAKLKMYGEPPPLSPIHIINRSKNAANGYKSPLVPKLPQESSKTTVLCGNYQNGVSVASAKPPNAIEISNPTNITSPLMLNRTYVKTVNPVKLNFSNAHDNESMAVDHFAEEFDNSPPLSLD